MIFKWFLILLIKGTKNGAIINGPTIQLSSAMELLSLVNERVAKDVKSEKRKIVLNAKIKLIGSRRANKIGMLFELIFELKNVKKTTEE